jgi:hypothetical protein
LGLIAKIKYLKNCLFLVYFFKCDIMALIGDLKN